GAFGEVQVMDWGLAKDLASGGRQPPEEAVAPPDRSAPTRGADAPRSPEPSHRTQPGSVLGTPAFMPPEQAGGETDKVDERADVFGLGAVLCTILTGKPPYAGPDADAVRLMAIRGHLADAFGRLDGCGAEPDLVALCKRCLSPDRD